MTETHGLGELLRSWRARLQPADVGYPPTPASRRTPGLRREEVSALAGVSPDYVKRLEQGRAHPSRAVLRALARALRLSAPEYELACRLAGHAAEIDGVVPRHIGPSVARLLDRLRDVAPVAVFDAAWTLLEHNDLWTALVGELPGGGRSANLVWLYFHDAPSRVRHPSPDSYRESLVADLRAVAARYPRDREVTSMIADLRATSHDFARWWDSAAVAHHGNERKTVDHPLVGVLELDCDVLTVHGADLRIVVFTAAPHSDAADRMRMLAVLGTEDMTAASAPERP